MSGLVHRENRWLTSGLFRIKQPVCRGFSYEKPAEAACRSGCAEQFWYRRQPCFFVARASLLRFLSVQERSRSWPERTDEKLLF